MLKFSPLLLTAIVLVASSSAFSADPPKGGPEEKMIKAKLEVEM